MRGKFITLEGIDGAGKSTHLVWLASLLESQGIPLRVTREPGGTEFGEKLRHMLLDRNQHLHPDTEALLMFAARREHIDKVIVPALETGSWVLCDRFTDATYAYQSGGSGLAWDRIAALEQWVQQGLQPDITLFFDIAPELGRARSERIKQPDRFEQEQDAYFSRVREAYLRRAQEHPERMYVIDGSASVAKIQKKLEPLVLAICELKR
jgi:dTMP kinase